MQSILDPTILYKDLSRDITEHDVDVVSDLWNMDGRDVYRGSRDTQYSHANVYWLYTEDLERVGLVEHSLSNHADFRILWFYDNPFATLLQEEGWTNEESLWSVLPKTTVERFFEEDWTTPEKILGACLYGPSRILTVDLILSRPPVNECSVCQQKSIVPLKCYDYQTQLTFPDKSKIVFIDVDLYVCKPPAGSRIWELLGFTVPRPPLDDEQALPELEQVPEEQLEPLFQTLSPLPGSPQEHSPLQEAQQQTA